MDDGLVAKTVYYNDVKSYRFAYNYKRISIHTIL